MGSENDDLSWILRFLFAMRSITHQVAESVKSKRQERTVVRSSPRRSHQSNEAVENNSETVAGTGAHNVGSFMTARNTNRPLTVSALMQWIVRRAVWLIPRFFFFVKRCTVPFYRAMGGTTVNALVNDEIGVEAKLLSQELEKTKHLDSI